MQLRPYQSLAVAAAWDFLRHREGNPALVLPTGAGKSPLMAALAREAVENWQGRVGILAHTQELVRQNADKLLMLWPEAPLGIYAAGLKRRDRFNPILCMQIQSVASKAAQLGRFDLLLVDEGHRIPLNGEGRYLEFIRGCRRFNPDLRIIVLTATPYRLQGRAVPICGPEHIASAIAYEARIPDLIAGGYLSPIVSSAGGVAADLSAVHLKGGEYVENELAAIMLPLVERTVADLLSRATGRMAGIVFCVNVAHAEAVLTALQARGEAAAMVHGGTAPKTRTDALAAFQSGALRWLVNVNVLSEGFDAPHIDLVAMLRATKSPGLYYQQVGRGFRMAPGKENCLVLDYVGNAIEHGPVDAIRVQSPRKEGAKAEVVVGKAKECPKCSAIVPVQTRVCECGHQWVTSDPTHLDRPVNAPLLSTEAERRISVHAVSGVKYAVHSKPGKMPCLRVMYQCGMRQFSEYVCVQHSGYARSKALAWWQRRAPDAICPRTADEAFALAYGLPSPIRITVDESAKYPEIIGHEFAERGAESGADTRGGTDPDALARPAGSDAMRGLRDVPRWLLPAVERQRAA